MSNPALPKGIRQNNPGNLRQAANPLIGSTLVDGFTIYPNLLTGTAQMFALLDDYYHHLGLKTGAAMISRYAPASENDLVAYKRFVATRLRMSDVQFETYDIHIERPWIALDFARAIIAQENGIPPTSWPAYPEWIEVSQIYLAMARTGRWVTL